MATHATSDRRRSQLSFVSDMDDRLDDESVHESYELTQAPKYPMGAPPLHRDDIDQEEHHLLTNQSNIAGSYVAPSWTTSATHGLPTANTETTTWAKIKKGSHRYNLFTVAGRQQIKKFATSSGPIEESNIKPQPIRSSRIFGEWPLHGWRFGVFAATIAVAVCLVIELAMLVCAVLIDPPDQGIGTLYTGSCSKTERLTLLLAIPLNIIATVLTATSNYVMQCLTAPSRREVDKAHASGNYLNIGISSIHNLLQSPSWKALTWLSLVVTTIPIHLLLNSAFFGALQANNYGVMLVSDTWAKDDSVQYSSSALFNGTTGAFISEVFSGVMAEQTTYLSQLNASECFKQYSNQIQTSTTNVMVVTKQDSGWYNTLPAPKAYGYNQDPYTTFDLPAGVGIYLNPFSGNADMVLNMTYNWTSGAIAQNVSGGLYSVTESYQADYPSVLSIFSAFDYHYWAIVKELNYNFNNSDMIQALRWSPNSWMCNITDVIAGKECASGKKGQEPPSPWLITPEQFEVDHCLVETAKEVCELQYSLIILIVVITCDVAKIMAMVATLFWVKEPPMTTLGDAVSSFLERPDSYTRGCCLLDQEEVRRLSSRRPWQVWRSWTRVGEHTYQQAGDSLARRVAPSVSVWKVTPIRWWSAPSKGRWYLFGVLYLALLASSMTVLWKGVSHLHGRGIDNPFGQGFGTRSPNAVFTYPVSFTTNSNSTGNTTVFEVQSTSTAQTFFADVVTVNTAQLLFSASYFVYNGLFTSMITAVEWTQFASTRKALRVSRPQAGQRSTYWLQLPWKYSLPLLVTSITLHWLVSQSLFIVRINIYGWDGSEQADRDITACGYSPLAILIVIIVIVVSLVVVIFAGWQKYIVGIPMCGTNSLAIAAACHYSKEGDSEVVCKALQWGVVSSSSAGYGDEPGHCSLSDQEVRVPVTGATYA